MKEKCCGTCRWHWRDRETNDWQCSNPISENYDEVMVYRDECECWERREECKN